MGEVGILGQAAKVPLVDRRLEEAQRLGFKRAFCPPVTREEKSKLTSLSLVQIADLNDLALQLK